MTETGKRNTIILGCLLALYVITALILHNVDRSLSAGRRANIDIGPLCGSPIREGFVFAATGNGGHDLYWFDIPSLSVARLTNTLGDESSPGISPDGRNVVYSYTIPEYHATMQCYDFRTKAISTLLTDSSADILDPVYSRDGKSIIFSKRIFPTKWGISVGPDHHYELFQLDLSSKVERQLTNRSYFYAGLPVVSADGKYISFIGRDPAEDSDGEVYQVDLAGSSVVRKAVGLKHVYATPVLSNDGLLMVYAGPCDNGNKSGLFVSPAARHDPKLIKVAREGETPLSPTFIEAHKVVYLSSVDYNYSVYEVNANGTGSRRLAGMDLFDDPLKWRPGK